MHHSSYVLLHYEMFFNQHGGLPTYTLLLACILTKSFFQLISCLFYLPALSTSTVLGTLPFLKYRQFHFFSTISLFRIILFLSFDFFLNFTFFLWESKTFDQSQDESFLTQIASCPPSILIMSFNSSTSFQPLSTSSVVLC